MAFCAAVTVVTVSAAATAAATWIVKRMNPPSNRYTCDKPHDTPSPVVYLALLVGLRLTGTRQLGQMSTFDLVLLLIIANAVQNAMVGPDTSLAGGLVAAGVLIGWHRVIDWWRVRSRGVSKLLAGEGIM